MNTPGQVPKTEKGNTFPERLGQAFGKLRRQQNFTQTEIADRLTKSGESIGQGYLSKVESAKKNASLARWKQLCDAIGVPIELLVFETIFVGQELSGEHVELLKTMRASILALFETAATLDSNQEGKTDSSGDSLL